MITPVEHDLYAQRHAAFPSTDPYTWTDEVTGLPLNLTGATITIEVRLYEGAAGAALLSETLAVISGPDGTHQPPSFSEADHEALFAAPTADSQTLQSRLKLRYDIKMAGVTGMPASYIAARGFYYVQTGVVV